MEKRVKNRVVKRLLVRYGVGCCNREGITGNVSKKGMCIRTNGGLVPRTRLSLVVVLPNGREVSLTGTVVWTTRVPSWASGRFKSGMGVSINPAGSGFVEYIEAVNAIAA